MGTECRAFYELPLKICVMMEENFLCLIENSADLRCLTFECGCNPGRVIVVGDCMH